MGELAGGPDWSSVVCEAVPQLRGLGPCSYH